MKNPILTDDELITKMAHVNKSYTRREKLEDRLVHVESYIVAMKKGWPHKMSHDEILEYLHETPKIIRL